MTDKRIKMDCPFCGTDKTKIELVAPIKAFAYAEVCCPNCGARVVGHGKMDAISKWNCRV